MRRLGRSGGDRSGGRRGWVGVLGLWSKRGRKASGRDVLGGGLLI